MFKFLYTKKSVVITTVVLLIFMGVILPLMSAQMVAIVGDAVSPDTSLIYSSSELYAMASVYGELGRRTYLIQRVTFDVVWPLAYGAFLLSVFGYAISNYAKIKRFKFLCYVPFIAVGFDYLENLFAGIVFYRFPQETMVIAQLAPVATFLKWLYVIFGMFIAMMLLGYIVIKKPDIDNN